MLGIILVTESPIRVQRRASGDVVVSVSDSHPQPGIYIYDVYCDSNINVNDGPWVQHINSFNASGRENLFLFREEIRDRDIKCVVTGVANAMAPYEWYSFVYIFHWGLWAEWDCGLWITDMDDINSCQNGFLLKTDVRQAC